MRRSVRDHLHALDGGLEQVVYHNAYHADSYGGTPSGLRGLSFDGVVLHTTFLCERWSDRPPLQRQRYAWSGALRCPKLALPQDEYDHSEVLDEWLAELGTTAVFTIFG